MQRIKTKLKKILENTLNIEIKRAKSNIQKSNSIVINEAVNFDKELIFIAIPKTGTTTVRSQLSQVGHPIMKNPHLNIVQVRDLIYIYLLRDNIGKNRTFPTENYPNDAELREKSDKIFNSFFKFSAVRNPWARAVSLYFRREGLKQKEKMTFDEFCDNHLYASDTCHYPTLHRNQYDWLSDENGNMLIDYVYKVEDFDDAINDIEYLTNGRVLLKNIKQNRNPNSKSNDYRNLYNDRTRKIIQKRFEKDIDYFKYSF